MLKRQFDLSGVKPFNRESTAEIAIAASRFESTFTMESGNSIINRKSMLGLLSHALPMKGEVTLAADGPDEEQVMDAILALLDKYRA